MFLIVDFLVHQISGIIRLQIEIERIFSSIDKFKKMSFTKDKFGEVVSKSWYIDSRVCFKRPFNLVELTEKDLEFKEELEQFEGSFE
jgi:hypothetical protein